MTSPLDRTDIQSLVLRSYPCAHSRHFLFRCPDKAGAKRFLAQILPSVTHAGIDLAAAPGPFLNVAVSWPGLDQLGAFDALGGVGPAAAEFPKDFRDPPDEGDIMVYGASAPAHWWNRRFATGDIGLTVHLYATGADDLARASDGLRAAARGNGVDELAPTRDGEAITGQVLGTGTAGLRSLHFGYSDGFSQPAVNWDADPALGDGPPANGKGTYPRRYFLIDEWDENLQSFPKAEPWRGLVRHASYMAIAWIYQDVAAFNRFLRDNAAEAALPGMDQAQAEEFLAAKMMGRWRDGTPLVHAPEQPDPARANEDFDYAADAQGLRCPLAAHIRITNVRDQPLDFVNRNMFRFGAPRVLRRGSSYGRPLTGHDDDGQDRGIFGMFFCANLLKQFYPLMRWIGATDFSDVYKDPHGQDPLFASRAVPGASDSFAIPKAGGPVVLKGLPDFVRIQGAANMLMPSLTTLRRLAA